MGPLKPPTNFKFKHFFPLVLINPSSSSKSIVAKTNILLPPSLEIQDGSIKSLFTIGASSSSILVGVEKPISLDFNHIVPKTKNKIGRLNGNLIECFEIFGLQNCLGQRQ
jgi:hypothetical protein